MLQGIRRVVCGISGGVDSAVAAYLLKKTGYDVHGVYMKNWDSRDEIGHCTGDVDIEDAKLTCRHLDIPFHEVNFVKQYWNTVFSYLLTEYQCGLTPNPDVLCNKHIKFDTFLCYATETLGGDAIATGHYAKSTLPQQDGHITAEGIKLLRPLDDLKDQTLFLSQISQTALQKTLFPLGDLLKKDVKQIAMQIGLERIARRKESMGICFIGSRNFHHFIEEYIEPRPADFIDIETGKVVGSHKGLHYWTLGQRCLISGKSKAYFVVEKDLETHSILVAPGTDHPSLFVDSFTVKSPHWIRISPFLEVDDEDIELDYKFQHIHPLARCRVKPLSDQYNRLHVSLYEPKRAITPGQFAVFYNGEECLGSAVIDSLGPSLFQQNYKERVSIPKCFS